jgi:hypothetical protein
MSRPCVTITQTHPDISFVIDVTSDPFDEVPMSIYIQEMVLFDRDWGPVTTLNFFARCIIGLRLVKQDQQSILDMTTFEYFSPIWYFYEPDDMLVVVRRYGQGFKARRLPYQTFYQEVMKLMRTVRNAHASFDPQAANHVRWDLIEENEVLEGDSIDEYVDWLITECRKFFNHSRIDKGNYTQLASFD